MSWCATADLREAAIVPRDAKMFADTVPLARKTVARLMRRTPRDIGRWVHATKDGCVMAAVARGQLPGARGDNQRTVGPWRGQLPGAREQESADALARS